MTPLQFAAALLGYCYATRASVTSWGRTVGHNLNVRGHALSYHLQFLGADVVYDGVIPYEDAARLAARTGLEVVREWKDPKNPRAPRKTGEEAPPGMVFSHDHLEPRPAGRP